MHGESRACTAKDPHSNQLIVSREVIISAAEGKEQDSNSNSASSQLQLIEVSSCELNGSPFLGGRWTSDCSYASWENHE